MRIRTVVVLVSAVISTLVVLLAVTWHHWWLKSTSVTITYDGRPAAQARVYRGAECFLLELGSYGDSSYVVYPMRRELGVAIDNRFVWFPGVVYSKDIPATYVPMGKMEVDSAPEFANRWVAFRSVTGKRIKAEW